MDWGGENLTLSPVFFSTVRHLTHPAASSSAPNPGRWSNHPITAVKWLPVLVGLVFTLIGLLLIPYAGIQADEALFADPIYRDWIPAQSITIGGEQVPLMLMSYLGTLKTTFYSFLFNRWRPGVWSLRVPVLLAGAVVVWLFAKLLVRCCRPRAAVLGCVLLAADVSYLLTSVFDWGPVALQHLLMVGGILLVLGFAQDGSRIRLVLGFLLFGLAVWDKALATWWLAGLGVATLAVFPRDVLSRLSLKNVLLAVAGFVIGAAPLILYNVQNPLATFSGNARFSTRDFSQKTRVLRLTLQGDGLFGYLVREEEDQPVRPPATTLEKASVAIRNAIGQHRRTLFLPLLVISLAAVPMWWKTARRQVLFALIFMAVTWLQMAFTIDAGGALHHTVLLFPFPHFLIAAVLGNFEWPRLKWIPAAAVALVALSNLIVLNQYFSQFIRNGPGFIWTDAISPLANASRAWRGRNILVLDWGIEGTLRMLDRGQLTLWDGEDNVRRGDILPLLSLDGLYISHATGAEVNQGLAARMKELASARGYQQKILRTVADRNGRPIFVVSEYVRSSDAQTTP